MVRQLQLANSNYKPLALHCLKLLIHEVPVNEVPAPTAAGIFHVVFALWHLCVLIGIAS
jgi:hypothetical protein